jgi:hypothetical protein
LAREAGEQVELCGWASALSAYLAGEALTDRIEESNGLWSIIHFGAKKPVMRMVRMASIIALRVSQVWLVVARIAASYSLLSGFS